MQLTSENTDEETDISSSLKDVQQNIMNTLLITAIR